MTSQLILDNTPLFWVAVYANGRTITQIGPNGSAVSVDELPRHNLRTMILQDLSGTVVATQSFIVGQCMLYRRRIKTVQGGGRSATHILGWAKFDDNGSTTALHVSFIDELTRTVEMGHFVESRTAIKYPIELSQIDRIPIS